MQQYHPIATLKERIKLVYRLLITNLETAAIFFYFIGIVIFFYTGLHRGLDDQLIFSVIAFTVLTDGLFLLLHLVRQPVVHENLAFDPSKLTVVIACRNGEKVIGNTITGALHHVPANQIIVVSDLSTDNTIAVAQSYGVRVYSNRRNLNKAFSISAVMPKVYTPYVLVLDDDTWIGDTFIPTSLLDDGYAAVAFNVLPEHTGTVVNAFQKFEYRKSMVMGKSLRGSSGAVGTISGALGLFRTADLQRQITLHSGQYGGEDQQRTAFVHLYGQGTGVTYTDSTVYTKVPDTWKQFLRQRSFRWNISLPELFHLNLKILLRPQSPFLLKVEKAYKLYLFLTDPLRIAFFWVAFLAPEKALILYTLYFLFNFLAWLKTGRKDPFWVVLFFPIFSSVRATCRLIAHTHWVIVKFRYIFTHQFHQLVPDRKLALEYATVFFLMFSLWGVSLKTLIESAFATYAQAQIVDYRSHDYLAKVITSPEPAPTVASEFVLAAPLAPPPSPSPEEPLPPTPDPPQKITVTVTEGDSLTKVSRKAVQQYSHEHGINLNETQKLVAEDAMSQNFDSPPDLHPGQTIELDETFVKKYIDNALSIS